MSYVRNSSFEKKTGLDFKLVPIKKDIGLKKVLSDSLIKFLMKIYVWTDIYKVNDRLDAQLCVISYI